MYKKIITWSDINIDQDLKVTTWSAYSTSNVVGIRRMRLARVNSAKIYSCR